MSGLEGFGDMAIYIDPFELLSGKTKREIFEKYEGEKKMSCEKCKSYCFNSLEELRALRIAEKHDLIKQIKKQAGVDGQVHVNTIEKILLGENI